MELPFSLFKNPKSITVWDHTFQFTADHLTLDDVKPLRYQYDELADTVLERLDAIQPPPPRSQARNTKETNAVPEQQQQQQQQPIETSTRKLSDVEPSKPEPDLSTPAPPPKRDLVALLRDHRGTDPALQRLWDEATTVPEWVDWDQIARGQEVFYRYSGASVNGLAFQSLVGGMGAGRVVEVLARTGGFRTSVARHRLYETTQYVLQVTRDLQSIRPAGYQLALTDRSSAGEVRDEKVQLAGELQQAGLEADGQKRRQEDHEADTGGDGWAASIRVRLLHSAVRKRILKLESTHPGYYDITLYGVPVNDIDCIGTIASFSASLIWLSFPRQGIYLRPQEISDYIALWRYVGYLVGGPAVASAFSSPAKSKAIMESLLLHEVHPSATSGILARNVIQALSSIPPTYASPEFLSATCRWLLGNGLCDALGIMRPPIYYKLLVAGQCIFFMAFNYTYRSVEAWDRHKIGLMRRGMWRWIVESEHGLNGEQSSFDFKHVPQLGKTTEFESAAHSGLIPKGVERRNLITFAVFGSFLFASAWIGWKIVGTAVSLVGRCW